MRKIFSLALIGAGLFLLLAVAGYWRFDEAVYGPTPFLLSIQQAAGLDGSQP
jgi:hypothetical protein